VYHIYLIQYIAVSEREKYLTEQGSKEKMMEEGPDLENYAKEQPVQLPAHIDSSLFEDVTQLKKIIQ
jgi:hypothetical protein